MRLRMGHAAASPNTGSGQTADSTDSSSGMSAKANGAEEVFAARARTSVAAVDSPSKDGRPSRRPMDRGAAISDRGCRFVLLAVSALLWLLTCAPATQADEAVTFPSASGVGIRGYLTKPAGGGPFPAVVLLHSCLGLPANGQAIGAEVAQWGYVSLFVDDFGPRSLKETCAVDFPD